GAKAKLGAIIGIEDNMPAYRVFDFDPRGKIHKIPFAQITTHEGHFPFRAWSRWTEEEKELPESFIPTVDVRSDRREWDRYRFDDCDIAEMAPYLAAELPLEEKAPPLEHALPSLHSSTHATPQSPFSQHDNASGDELLPPLEAFEPDQEPAVVPVEPAVPPEPIKHYNLRRRKSAPETAAAPSASTQPTAPLHGSGSAPHALKEFRKQLREELWEDPG